MDTVIIDWLNLAVRWFHVVAGIAWIGASFYFIWLDLNLRQPPQWKLDKGMKGDLWAIHGGGIYEVGKYRLRPDVMPEKLHWFKWEAYTTWLSGTGLLILLYYLQAQSYLVGNDSWIHSPGWAIGASIAYIALGQLAYEVLLRTPLVKRGLVFAGALLVLIGLASWLAQNLFSGRAAYLHVGAMIATWMAGNVYWGIIPAQKKFVAAVSANREPDLATALFAKLRSTHNNYLTLPVIFCMLSNHYPFLYGHPHAWLVLLAIGALLAWGRHYFNLKHRGIRKPGILVGSGIGLIIVAILSSTLGRPSLSVESVEAVTSDEITALITTHCTGCHARNPSQPGFNAPPAGLVIDDAESLLASKARSAPAIRSGYMPLGNMTELTDEQRNALLVWLEQ